MFNKRIERVNSLIEKELGQIILREIDFPEGSLVTLTRAETSVDLANARVYIAVFPSDKVDRALDILSKMVYELQKILDRRLRLRPIPKIRFVREKQTAEEAKIEGLLEELKNEGK